MFLQLGLLTMLCIFSADAVGQKTVANSQVELWHSMGRPKEKFGATLAQTGFKETVTLGEWCFDINHDNVYDTALFKATIVENFPRKNDTGMCIIDTEGKAYQDFCRLPADSIAWQEANAKLMSLLKIGKSLRPNVKWGYYNIPFSTYWNKNENWKNQGNKMKIMFESVDVLAISLYDYFPDTTKFSDNESYHKDNTDMALKYAVQFNKPLYIYIWQRWHESHEKLALEIIPQKTFEKHLQWILNTTYKGIGITGLIWFDIPGYVYSFKKYIRVQDSVALKTISRGDVKSDMIRQYGALIKKVMAIKQKDVKRIKSK